MKTNNKTTSCLGHTLAAAIFVLGAQLSLAGSATWLSSPQDAAWENTNNWTPGGPPNGPSDIATFAQSSQRDVDVSTLEQVNSIVFAPNSASFTLHVSPFGAPGGELSISGTGVTNNSSVLQTFVARNEGQIIFTNASSAGSANMSIINGGFSNSSEDSTGSTIFNDTSSAGGASIKNFSVDLGFYGDIGRTIFNGASTADHASISNYGPSTSHGAGGQTIFNDTSTAANASIENLGSGLVSTAGSSQTIFNTTSTAGHATITNHGGLSIGGQTIFKGSSTADNAILIANEGMGGYGGGILFNAASTGGSAQVKVFDNGYLDISGRQPGITIGSIEGS